MDTVVWWYRPSYTATFFGYEIDFPQSRGTYTVQVDPNPIIWNQADLETSSGILFLSHNFNIFDIIDPSDLAGSTYRLWTINLTITIKNIYHIEHTFPLKVRIGYTEEPSSFDPWGYGE